MIDEATPIIRYSRRPLASYLAVSSDPRVQRPEVWNLAFLSHDYDNTPEQGDPLFLTHVRRTCQMDLATGEPDLTFGLNGERLLAEKLLMPAPWFINWLAKTPKLMIKTPLFKAYGQAWLRTIEQRSRLCHTHDNPDDQLDLGTLQQARGVLVQFARR